MVVLPLLTALLLTQSAPTDTLPFHRGEWAAQFAGGGNFSSLGFLKFRAPKQALVLDIRVGVGHSEELRTDSTGTHFGVADSHANISLRFGWRRYHAVGPKVAAYHSLGLLGGFGRSVAWTLATRSVANAWTAGVFGDIGGSYFLTPRLSVGATISADIHYSDAFNSQKVNAQNVKTRAWDLEGSAPGVGFVAALYF